MAEPGTIITAVTLAYAGAVAAWTVLRDAYDFPQDSEDLVTRLDLERFRFQTWGRNAGLSDGGLHSSLMPIHPLIQNRLVKVKGLLEKGNKLVEEHCLPSRPDENARPALAKGILSGIAESVRAGGGALQSRALQRDLEYQIKLRIPQGESARSPAVGLRKRIRWSLGAKSSFETLVLNVETHVNKLKDLLTESLQQSTAQDWKRVSIIVVGNAKDDETLKAILDARKGSHDAQMLSLAEKKAIDVSGKLHTRSGFEALAPLNMNDFVIPTGSVGRNRFVGPSTSGEVFLFEKKSYEQDISSADKKTLKARLDRLILLLSSNSRSESLRTFPCIGCIDDPNSFCWWLLFRLPFPITPVPQPLSPSAQPVSLATYLGLKTAYKPPLEHRLSLAAKMASTVSELYSSSWLHKSLRSENILFPALHDPSDPSTIPPGPYPISAPRVAGFEYSRQDTEAQTIDKGRRLDSIVPAIYRHPQYQGLAAQGYRMHHDIYSFGLVLAEIAWWVPLLTFLDADVPAKPARPDRPPPPPKLSSKMTRFAHAEALELRRLVHVRIERDLAFRVGERFCAVVRWCLGFEDGPAGAPAAAGPGAGEGDGEWRSALEFYDRVVVPLERIAGEAGGDVRDGQG